MELIGPLIAQGGAFVLAAAAFWLYIHERAEHREDIKAHKEELKEKDSQIQILNDGRLADVRGALRDNTDVMRGTSQAVSILGEKIEVGKYSGARN